MGRRNEIRMMKPELLESIETPAVLLDRYKLAANIEKMQDLANAHHVKLRPHIKTQGENKGVRATLLTRKQLSC